MANLSILPNETLVEILSCLPCADLARTCLVSHRFHSVSLALLYNAPCFLQMRRTRSPLELFLTTLLAPGYETVANRVRCLSMHWDTIPHMTRAGGVSLRVLMAATRSEKIHYLPNAGQNTQFMLLLHLLTRLNVLRMGPPIYNFVRYLQSQKCTGADIPTGLRSLREFHAEYSTTGYLLNDAPLDDYGAPVGLPHNALLGLMRLPSIDHISGCVIQQDVHAHYAIEVVPHSSTVTKLRFVNSNLPDALLTSILSVPAALTHFSYSAAAVHWLEMPQLMAALEQVCNTLQYLELDIGAAQRPADRSPALTSCSMAHWSALRKVTCPVLLLLGTGDVGNCLADVLPRGLREIVVGRDWRWGYTEVVERLVEMLQRKDECIPGLERMVVYDSPEVGTVLEAELADACRVAGVRWM